MVVWSWGLGDMIQDQRSDAEETVLVGAGFNH